eukprot:GFUD01020736.1.p1 GENE.GFUD01020736.1~~GFUD01020736.1.p1  ORF type:complete len:479 (-),score=106.16 GFUD01020736.1:18-1454(-)
MPAVKYLSVLNPAEVSWSVAYVCLAWLAQLGNGAIQTITGPMQPYLAYNLRTDTQTINLVWTLGFSGFLLGSLFTSNVFTKYLTTSHKKLSFMSLAHLLTGVSTLMMPFMANLPMLLLCRFVQFLSYGVFLTSDSILLVFTLGPEKSRPFINALHFFISIGFLLGTFLVQPFLPASSDKVCLSQTQNNKEYNTINKTLEEGQVALHDQDTVEADPVIPILHGVQSIAWPFIISGVWCILIAAGFLVLSRMTSFSMPQFYDENINTKHKDTGLEKLPRKNKQIFLILVVIFFALSGGIIRVFQSMSMTFALCGPLQLESHRAALTDSFYSSGMCFGRLASIFLSTVLLPSTLLAVCMLACLLGTILLIFLAPIFHISLYTGVAIMGFFLSWQFGTGFSWTSQHMNITGRLSSVFFIGLGVGSLSSPPLAGWLFILSPMNVIYAVAVMVTAQVVTVGAMWAVTRGFKCCILSRDKLNDCV